MAYGMSCEQAVELLYKSAKKEHRWVNKQLRKLLRRM